MAKIGYARVSTRGQKDDSQVDDLTAYGCEKIFTDTSSGKNAARPELDKALDYRRAGDVLVITRLSRAMRSLKHLLALADELRERGGGLVVLRQQIDTTTPTGRLVFHILGAIDEFQRELVIEGTREGLAAARARGRTGGRTPKLNDRQAATVDGVGGGPVAGKVADAVCGQLALLNPYLIQQAVQAAVSGGGCFELKVHNFRPLEDTAPEWTENNGHNCIP